MQPPIDFLGNVHANSEDGNLYVVKQSAPLPGHIFLKQPIGSLIYAAFAQPGRKDLHGERRHPVRGTPIVYKTLHAAARA